MKLKQSILDKIFRKNRYKEVIKLRNQISYMIDEFNKLSVLTRLSNYYTINSKMFQKDVFTLNEVSMYNHLGEEAVINRLRNDRNEIYNLLTSVKEIDITDISISIRDEKLNNILC